MLRTAVRHILLLIPLLCCTLLADGQVLDSAAEARIKDTVDRYYRLHPRRHPSHRPSDFRVMPLFGAMYTQETEFLAMGGLMGSGRTSEDTLAPPSTVGAVLMISTNLSAAGAITGAWVSRRGDFLVQYSAAYIYGPRYFWGLGYEAASLDGASKFQQAIHITLPALKPVIITTTVLRLIWTANTTDLIFTMTTGGPGYSTHVLALYTYLTAWTDLDFGYSSAMAIFLMLVLLIFIGIYMKLINKDKENDII